MNVIKKRYEVTLQILNTLKEVLDELHSCNKYFFVFCDATIQRFKYSIDSFFKFLAIYMSDFLVIPIDVASPRPIIREAFNAKLITQQEYELLMSAIIRRNETSHAYNKELAGHIITEIPVFYNAMMNVLQRIDIDNKD